MSDSKISIRVERETVAHIVDALYKRWISAQTDLTSRYADRREAAVIATAEALRVYQDATAAAADALGIDLSDLEGTES